MSGQHGDKVIEKAREMAASCSIAGLQRPANIINQLLDHIGYLVARLEDTITINKFQVGDKVEHQTMGAGTISKIEDGCVFVDYEKWQTKGQYDREWFHSHPNLLIPSPLPAPDDMKEK